MQCQNQCGEVDTFCVWAVVRNDESGFAFLHDLRNAFHPRLDLFHRIQVVVALRRIHARVIRKPSLRISSMKTNISHGGSHVGGWLQRSSNDGLIDIAEPCASFFQKFVSLRDIQEAWRTSTTSE